MRRLITTILLFSSAINYSFANPGGDHANVSGTWVPVKQAMNGHDLPSTAFEKQKLVIGADDTYTMYAESTDKGVIRFKESDKMDIWGRAGVNAGKHFMAIYKYEDGQLTICYNLAGDTYPQSFDTKDKPTFFISTFRKE